MTKSELHAVMTGGFATIAGLYTTLNSPCLFLLLNQNLSYRWSFGSIHQFWYQCISFVIGIRHVGTGRSSLLQTILPGIGEITN